MNPNEVLRRAKENGWQNVADTPAYHIAFSFFLLADEEFVSEKQVLRDLIFDRAIALAEAEEE